MEFCIARSSAYDSYGTYRFRINNLNSYVNYPTLNPVCTLLPPTVPYTELVYNLNQTAFPLEAVGTNILWYTSETGGTGSTVTPTPDTSVLGVTSYWVSQTENFCESPRIEIKVTVLESNPTGKSLHFDGVNDIVVVDNFDYSVSNTFTLDFWVKPEKAIILPTEGTSGIAGSTNQSYPLFPTLISDYVNLPNANHAMAGVSVGTNGIGVFEHNGFYLPCLLAYTTTITDWTRVTVVYNNKQPSLYINGVLVHTGLTSQRQFVHPTTRDFGGSNNGDHSSYGPFEGYLDRVYILNDAVVPNATCEPDPNGSNIIVSYLFDQGTAGSDNSSIDYLIDSGLQYNGELLGFTLNGIASNWLSDEPTDTIPTAPVTSDQTFCSSSTVADLVPAPSATMSWYDQSIGGVPLEPTDALVSGVYYVSQTDVNGCQSSRNFKTVQQSTLINPIVSSPVNYDQGDTASPLTATGNGSSLLWYTVSSGGTGSITAPIPDTSVVGSTSYWVAATDDLGCESAREEIVVYVNSTIPATHLNFDGTDDRVNIGNTLATTFNGGNFFTVEAYINIPNTTGLKTIFNNHDGGPNTQLNLRVNNNTLEGFMGFGTYIANSGSNTLSVNTWYHVAMVYNDSTLKLYLDGVEVANTNVPLSYSLINSSQTYAIGASGYSTEVFLGDIDELRVWNRALPVAEIQNNMNCELPNVSTQNGLLRYYQFNQGFDSANNMSVTTLPDISNSANNGTLLNFSLNNAISNWKSGSIVISGNQCTTLSVNDYTAIEERFKLYPNPTADILKISNAKRAMYNVDIIDINGRVLISKSFNETHSELNLGNLATGVYIVKIRTTLSEIVKRVIKK